MKNILTGTVNLVSDIFFPLTCAVCQTEGHSWCEADATLTPWPICFTCRGAFHQEARGRCLNSLPVISLGYYDNRLLRETIHRWKYEGYWQMSNDWGRLLATMVQRFATEPTPLVPIPLHWVKRLSRGYNQSEVLAQQISKHTSWNVLSKSLVRTKRTKPQMTIADASNRAANVRGVFALEKKGVLPSRVWLVDDVLTTGSTLHEAVATLKKAHVTVAGIACVAIARQSTSS